VRSMVVVGAVWLLAATAGRAQAPKFLYLDIQPRANTKLANGEGNNDNRLTAQEGDAASGKAFGLKARAEGRRFHMQALGNGFSEEGLVAVVLGSDEYFVSSTD
jgi:hypothetical protein